jgi:hypothetical protein
MMAHSLELLELHGESPSPYALLNQLTLEMLAGVAVCTLCSPLPSCPVPPAILVTVVVGHPMSPSFPQGLARMRSEAGCW